MKLDKFAKAKLMGATCIDCQKDCFAVDSDAGIREWTIKREDGSVETIIRDCEKNICKKFKWNQYRYETKQTS